MEGRSVHWGRLEMERVGGHLPHSLSFSDTKRETDRNRNNNIWKFWMTRTAGGGDRVRKTERESEPSSGDRWKRVGGHSPHSLSFSDTERERQTGDPENIITNGSSGL